MYERHTAPKAAFQKAALEAKETRRKHSDLEASLTAAITSVLCKLN